MRRKRWMRSCLLVCALGAALCHAGDAVMHDPGQFQGRVAHLQRLADGGFRLQPADSVDGKPPAIVEIAAPPMVSDTNSALFDGLFALAQQEMLQDRVQTITDGTFDNGRPLPCDCYQTGAKWPYVWTRDVSFAGDLALARLDPERMRRTLRFKLSKPRSDDLPSGLYVTQDTGSGGSWPVSTDRVVWFLAARHLLDDAAFADDTWRALRDTLAQDRVDAFDPRMGLYRGETSFLDWREQSYPVWTANDVRFIAESFALSTNVLHFEALRLAADLAERHGDADAAATYRAQATALATAIDSRFWNARRGMVMSYIGTAEHPVPYEAYDLLGISLAVLSDVLPESHARASLANYPVTDAGSPVIWPQQPGVPIYHNRAIWPFVSAYALRAARKLDMPERIAHETRSLMRGAALSGSNMENYEFTTLLPHVDDGALSGPVVNSPRQLWSVAGYMDMVLEGVFGIQADGTLAPKLPIDLVPELFGGRETIRLRLPGRSVTMRRPPELSGNVLVAGDISGSADDAVIQLVATTVAASPLKSDMPQFAPPSPPAPTIERDGERWRIRSEVAGTLYVDGVVKGAIDDMRWLSNAGTQQCFSMTRTGNDGVQSLHSPTTCIGKVDSVAGSWPRQWRAGVAGRYRARLRYDNPHGPINTGVTAAVRHIDITCIGAPLQLRTVVLPHSVGEQWSTSFVFGADVGDRCTFELRDAGNMSALRHFARYTGGEGGSVGSLNAANIGSLDIALAGAGTPAPSPVTQAAESAETP